MKTLISLNSNNDETRSVELASSYATVKNLPLIKSIIRKYI